MVEERCPGRIILVGRGRKERMTIETLEAYRGITSEIQALETELKTLHADSLSQTSGQDAMKDRLTAKRKRWSDQKLSIESWLDTVEDAEIRAIVRWHYIIGYNWRETASKVYGRGDYYIARKRICRFFGRE